MAPPKTILSFMSVRRQVGYLLYSANNVLIRRQSSALASGYSRLRRFCLLRTSICICHLRIVISSRLLLHLHHLLLFTVFPAPIPARSLRGRPPLTPPMYLHLITACSMRAFLPCCRLAYAPSSSLARISPNTYTIQTIEKCTNDVSSVGQVQVGRCLHSLSVGQVRSSEHSQ